MKIVPLRPQLLMGFFILKIMITKLEELKKRQLIKIIKTLWIEKKLNAIESGFPVINHLRIDKLEELALEMALEIEENILSYFDYDV